MALLPPKLSSTLFNNVEIIGSKRHIERLDCWGIFKESFPEMEGWKEDINLWRATMLFPEQIPSLLSRKLVLYIIKHSAYFSGKEEISDVSSQVGRFTLTCSMWISEMCCITGISVSVVSACLEVIRQGMEKCVICAELAQQVEHIPDTPDFCCARVCSGFCIWNFLDRKQELWLCQIKQYGPAGGSLLRFSL